MRPTPEGVGNAVWILRAAGAGGASMRPTPEGVGNSAGGRGGARPVGCFNEAHARRRGKFASRSPRR